MTILDKYAVLEVNSPEVSFVGNGGICFGEEDKSIMLAYRAISHIKIIVKRTNDRYYINLEVCNSYTKDSNSIEILNSEEELVVIKHFIDALSTHVPIEGNYNEFFDTDVTNWALETIKCLRNTIVDAISTIKSENPDCTERELDERTEGLELALETIDNYINNIREAE